MSALDFNFLLHKITPKTIPMCDFWQRLNPIKTGLQEKQHFFKIFSEVDR